MICDVCYYIHQNRMLHVLRTHEKWQQCLASNQSKINRSQETKTNIISFSHSLRMHVSLYVRIRKGRVIHLRHSMFGWIIELVLEIAQWLQHIIDIINL